MKKKITIYGAGGLGREVLSLLNALPAWEVTGFYDDGKTKGAMVSGVQVLGAMSELIQSSADTQVVVAIGNSGHKKRVAEMLMTNPFIQFPTLIHPAAVIQDASVSIGNGSIITAGVILTTGITLGSHVLVNLNATVGHDVQIGSFSSIMPGVNIAGNVTVGEAVLIGSGANILNGLHLGDHSRIGAGAVVTKNVEPNNTVVGVPARVLNLNP